jgi:DNA mismatch repair protein MSH5
MDTRHPLQELVDDRFVANDAYAVGRSAAQGHGGDRSTSNEGEGSEGSSPRSKNGNSVVICTGANASGKSVYLKQCVLIPYMAQVSPRRSILQDSHLFPDLDWLVR